MSGKLRVVGLDISLASTGLSDGYAHRAVQTAADESIECRMDRIVRGVMSFALSPVPGRFDIGHVADLAVIEAGAFSRGSQSAAAEYLSALRFMVRHRLWRAGIPFAMVAPNTMKHYVTRYGNATKQQVVAALDARHGAALATVKVMDGRYDMADALGLAAMGYDHVDQPLPVMQHLNPADAPHRDSLHAVKWPELLSQ